MAIPDVALTSGDFTYPASPADVPHDLTRPSAAYRKRAWLALFGLMTFFCMYVALAAWFGWLGFRLLIDAGRADGPGIIAGLMAAAALFLCAFMTRAIFFVRIQQIPNGILVTPATQPRLFEFLGRLAAELGARSPRRVYVSAQVNAAVFYDISIWNVVMPARRNLEIGLGLVNVLTLLELKAVLAHEFGHFSQRSMLFGRWVYISGQVAGHLVAKRDAFDRFLEKSTRVFMLNPIGMIWFATVWTVRLCVWAIREVTDASYRLLLTAQRAISREMEFQADLVAVSVTGSDPPVHALHKLQAAEAALQNAVTFAVAERERGVPPPDLFDLQDVALVRLRQALALADFGRTPTLPDTQREQHRVFKSAFARASTMWATHPPCAEREDNCKRRYVPSQESGATAWSLFEAPESLRAAVTAAALQSLQPRTEVTGPQPASREDASTRFGKTFDRPALSRMYQGAYLRAFVARTADQPSELYGPPTSASEVLRDLAALYPPSLAQDVETMRQLTGERDYFRGLQNGSMLAANGTILFRGRNVTRSDLPAVVAEVEVELQAVTRRIGEHDARCRAVHRTAALTHGGGWDAYLGGLLEMLHYAEHTLANILFAQLCLSSALVAHTRGGRIEGKDLHHVLGPANKLYDAMREAFMQRVSVSIDAVLSRRMGFDHWPFLDYKFDLVFATAQNLGAWLGVIGGWTRACQDAFGQLRQAALDQLLETEALVADAVTSGRQLTAAPAPSVAPAEFTRLRLGTENNAPAAKDWLERWQGSTHVLAKLGRMCASAVLIVLISVVSLKIGGSEDPDKEYSQALAAAGRNDFVAAADWYRKAAVQGFAAAQNNLGVLYSTGAGVKKDASIAAHWFRLSAEQNDPQAQLNLGLAYANGFGVPRDTGQALTWFQKAADHGNAMAQTNVALHYLRGEGVPADVATARRWLDKAVAQNYDPARKLLADIQGR
jgi:TPR repeat protein/Zn-dependent protease with chaperone function